MTVREQNGHANHQHEIRDALPAYQAAEELSTTSVITDVPDDAPEAAMLGNVNGAMHAPGEQ